MTKTKKKLCGFFSRKIMSNATSENEVTNWITIPERKSQDDLLENFKSILNKSDYLSDSSNSFNSFAIGYMFSIDRLLNIYRNIRLKYHKNLIKFDISYPKTETLKPLSRDYLKSIFEKIFNVSSSNYDIGYSQYKDKETQEMFISFIYGYNNAKLRAIEVCEIIEKDYYDNSRFFEYSIYAIWDLLSVELIILNNDNKLVKNYINENF